MIVVTHEMGFAEGVGGRVVFMDDGQIVETAEPEEMFARPREDRTRRFLAECSNSRSYGNNAGNAL